MTSKLITGLIVLLVALMGYYIFSNLERVEVVINEGPTSEVLRTPYHAASKYLESKNLDVSYRSTPLKQSDLNSNELLILTNTNSVADEETALELIEWVSSGGHLVWTINIYTDEHNGHLATLLGIEVLHDGEGYDFYEELDDIGNTTKSANDDQVEGEEKNQEITSEDSLSDEFEELQALLEAQGLASNEDTDFYENLRPSEQTLYDIHYEESRAEGDEVALIEADSIKTDLGRDPIFFITDNYHSFRYPSKLFNEQYSHKLDSSIGQLKMLYSGESDNGKKLIHFSLGSGEMTLVTSTDIWSNYEIGLFDHAHLLGVLAEGSDAVIFQNDIRWPSIWSMLTSGALETLVALGLIFIVIFTMKVPRFGPIAIDRSLTRRSIIEHVSAVAKFHWRHEQSDHLLAPLRQSIYQKMRLYLADFDQLSDKQRYQWLANRLGMSIEQISVAFDKETELQDWQFTHVIQLLEKIRKTL